MSKFNQGDKVVISATCKDAEYRGIAGTVLEVRPYYSDGLINRVCLDKPVNNACVFWFADDELQDANKLVAMTSEHLCDNSVN